jgi:O-antigen/teichoic acid export membrane protein
VVLLRYLEVVRLGQYVTVMSIVAVAGTVAEAGLNIVGTRELALRAGPERRALLAELLGLRLTITPVVVLAAVGFALAAGYPRVMVLGTLLAGIGLVLVMVQSTLMLLPTVELRNGRVTASELLKQVVTVAGIVVLAAAGAGLLPFFAVQVAVGVVVLAASPLLVGRAGLVLPRFDRGASARMLRETLPVAVAFVLGSVYFRIVILLMSLIATEYETGLFGASLRVSETLMMIPVLVAGVVLPVLSAAARDDRPRLAYQLQKLTEVALLAGVLAVLVFAIAAEDLLVLLGGEEYRPAGDVLRIQIGALAAVCLSQLLSSSLIALHAQRALIWVNGLAVVGMITFAAILIPLDGARGGALATVLGDVLLVGLLLVRLRRTDASVAPSFRFAWRVAAAAALGAAVLLIGGLNGFVAAAIAAVVFAAAAWALGAVPGELAGALRGRGPGAAR